MNIEQFFLWQNSFFDEMNTMTMFMIDN